MYRIIEKNNGERSKFYIQKNFWFFWYYLLDSYGYIILSSILFVILGIILFILGIKIVSFPVGLIPLLISVFIFVIGSMAISGNYDIFICFSFFGEAKDKIKKIQKNKLGKVNKVIVHYMSPNDERLAKLKKLKRF